MNMSKLQKMIAMALVATVALGGSSAFAKGKKHHGGQPTMTNALVSSSNGVQAAGKKQRERHPHGVVTAVSSGSITIEKGKKHKTKTFTVSANVHVEKKHGKKHGAKAQATVPSSGKKSNKHAHKGGKKQNLEVKVGDHVRLSLEGKQVVKIEVRHAKHHKQSKGAKAGKSL